MTQTRFSFRVIPNRKVHWFRPISGLFWVDYCSDGCQEQVNHFNTIWWIKCEVTVCGSRYIDFWKPVDCEPFRFWKPDSVITVSPKSYNFCIPLAVQLLFDILATCSSLFSTEMLRTRLEMWQVTTKSVNFPIWDDAEKKSACVIICWKRCKNIILQSANTLLQWVA